MVVFTFSVLDGKHYFGGNLIQKLFILSLSGIWCLDQFQYKECIGSVHCFCFRPKHVFGQIFTKKSQNCQFQLKFPTKTVSNMQNSVMVFTFFVLNGKHSFLENLVQKIRIVSFSLNLVPKLIRICRIQW